MPLASSYFLIPHAHNALKKPASDQNMKYLWTALEAPKVSGKAFHWIPVRKTKKIASRAIRGSIGRRPPPGFLMYCLSGFLVLLGIKGSAIAQNPSVISHECFCFIFPSNFVIGEFLLLI
jgi:hypothetical protein